MKLLIKIATVICLLLSVVWSQNNAIFFTTVLPEIPTSQDSVVLEAMGFFTRGKLIDFTKAVSGNEFHLNFIVKDTTTGGRCKTIENYSLGKLSEGNYKVITTTKKIKLHSYDTTQVKDTFNFQVVSPNVIIPKNVNQKCVNRYLEVNDSNPKNSYYYWNGDTLSIAIAFYWGSFETNYFVNYGYYNDTLFLNICDTMPSETLLYDGYIVTASFFPVPHSTIPVNVHYKRMSENGPQKIEKFYQMAIDYREKGIGLSFRKTGKPEYILYPHSGLVNYYIHSPYLDTLKSIGIYPNPYYKPVSEDSIYVGKIYHEDSTIEDWKSFSRNDWNFVLAQETDSFTFDTTNINRYSVLQVCYSNVNKESVTSYVYRQIDTMSSAQYQDPYVRVGVLLKKPGNTSHISKRANGQKIKNSGHVKIQKLQSAIKITNSILPLECMRVSRDRLKIELFDMRGKLLITQFNRIIDIQGTTITAEWDEKELKKMNFSGTYLMRIKIGNVALSTNSTLL